MNTDDNEHFQRYRTDDWRGLFTVGFEASIESWFATLGDVWKQALPTVTVASTLGPVVHGLLYTSQIGVFGRRECESGWGPLRRVCSIDTLANLSVTGQESKLIA
jgi:hypothetical protein